MNTGGRPKAPLILADDERQKLESWANRPKSTLRLATRGSCWPAPRASTTRRSPLDFESTSSPSASGAGVS